MLLPCEFLQIDAVLVLVLARDSRPLYVRRTPVFTWNECLDLAEDAGAPSCLCHMQPKGVLRFARDGSTKAFPLKEILMKK
jgi:hypothetical protein